MKNRKDDLINMFDFEFIKYLVDNSDSYTRNEDFINTPNGASITNVDRELNRLEWTHVFYPDLLFDAYTNMNGAISFQNTGDVYGAIFDYKWRNRELNKNPYLAIEKVIYKRFKEEL